MFGIKLIILFIVMSALVIVAVCLCACQTPADKQISDKEQEKFIRNYRKKVNLKEKKHGRQMRYVWRNYSRGKDGMSDL